MSLWSVLTKRVLGLPLQTPKLIYYQVVSCSSNASDSSQHHADDCDDAPIPDMENPYKKDRKVCILCKMNVTPNYKNPKLLSQFVSMYTGKIYGRHITGLCRRRQEQVEAEICKSQSSGLMPFYLKDPAFMQDPQLFNPDTPFRNHRY